VGFGASLVEHLVNRLQELGDSGRKQAGPEKGLLPPGLPISETVQVAKKLPESLAIILEGTFGHAFFLLLGPVARGCPSAIVARLPNRRHIW